MGLTRACLRDKHRLNRFVQIIFQFETYTYLAAECSPVYLTRERSGLNTRCWSFTSPRFFLLLFAFPARSQLFCENLITYESIVFLPLNILHRFRVESNAHKHGNLGIVLRKPQIISRRIRLINIEINFITLLFFHKLLKNEVIWEIKITL